MIVEWEKHGKICLDNQDKGHKDNSTLSEIGIMEIKDMDLVDIENVYGIED